MTVYVPTLDQRELGELADDIRQLTEPWQREIIREFTYWDRNRNRKFWQDVIPVTEPPLLDQLRLAAAGGIPQHVPRQLPRRRPKPDSKPPPGFGEAASKRLADLYVGLSGWVTWFRLPTATWVSRELDWQKHALRALAARAGGLDRPVAEELARDVRRWWWWAVVQAQLDPEEELSGRGKR